MGKQICPDEPLFAASAGSGRGAGALVDLNLEGGENRVDIDLFGEPEGERSSLDHPLAKETDDTAATGESPEPAFAIGSRLHPRHAGARRGRSPTREMPPRDEPTVESELMNFADCADHRVARRCKTDRRCATASPRSSPASKADQTAEVSIDDLGPATSISWNRPARRRPTAFSPLAETDHPADAPTMVAGLDERSRRMMEEAAKNSRDRDLTELERELEASFIADLDAHQEEIKTAVLGPESAPTVLMPRESRMSSRDRARQIRRPSSPTFAIRSKVDLDSTSKLRGINADSIDLDLDRLATALGQRRYRRAAACGRGSVLDRGVRGQSAQPARRSRRRARR